jgi:hypothetical protein
MLELSSQMEQVEYALSSGATFMFRQNGQHEERWRLRGCAIVTFFPDPQESLSGRFLFESTSMFDEFSLVFVLSDELNSI